jgi:hypothetical protein
MLLHSGNRSAHLPDFIAKDIFLFVEDTSSVFTLLERDCVTKNFTTGLSHM